MFSKISSISWEIWGGAVIRAGALITANTVYTFFKPPIRTRLYKILILWVLTEASVQIGFSFIITVTRLTRTGSKSVAVQYAQSPWILPYSEFISKMSSSIKVQTGIEHTTDKHIVWLHILQRVYEDNKLYTCKWSLCTNTCQNTTWVNGL